VILRPNPPHTENHQTATVCEDSVADSRRAARNGGQSPTLGMRTESGSTTDCEGCDYREGCGAEAMTDSTHGKSVES